MISFEVLCLAEEVEIDWATLTLQPTFILLINEN
jgi:hypothetical protein